ncbi:MAG: TetR/AcrR family transcriptional regulator [Bacteroidota bacterium]
MEVRERIIVESGILFGKYGIRSMTMDALAEEMGISKRTIYERFKDKDTLLSEVLKYYKEKQAEEALAIMDASDNPIEALFRMVKVTINRHAQMNPLFFHDLKKYHTRVFKKLSEPGEIRDSSITEKLLNDGVSQQVFSSQINIEIVNRTLHALFDLFGHDSSMVEAGYHRKDMFDHIIIPYLRGISTEKGVTLLEEHKTILD